MFLLEPTSVKVTLEYVRKSRTDAAFSTFYETIIVTGCCAVDARSFARLTYGDIVSDISLVIPESEIDPNIDRKFTPTAEYLFGKDQPTYSAGWVEGYADGEAKGREAGYRAGYQDGRKARTKNDRKHQPKPARKRRYEGEQNEDEW